MTFQFHTCCQSDALKNKTLHFSQVSTLLSRSLAYFHVSHVLLASLSPPLSPLSVRLLVFHTQQLPRPYCTMCAISEWRLLLIQAASEARPQLANCGSIVVALMHGGVLELAPKRENHGEKMTGERESTMARLRLFQSHMCHSSNQSEIGFSRCSLFLRRRVLRVS